MKAVKRIVEEHLMVDPIHDRVEEFMSYGSVEDRIKFLSKPVDDFYFMGVPAKIIRVVNTINGDVGFDVNKDVFIVKEKQGKMGKSLEFEVMSREDYEQNYTEQ